MRTLVILALCSPLLGVALMAGVVAWHLSIEDRHEGRE
jgi:hypothetical protein